MIHMINSCIQTKDEKLHWISTCLNCGQCEKKCPRGIKIRDTFKLVQKDLEGPVTRALARMARTVMNRRKNG
ncbi:MAG: 4Fe-4S dicluster domain-containing protein [Spirochaetaceae bacterium]|nr:4Fe-4S dicluster domain-containing protein [Spirochaetaceae bacterium]